MKRRLLLVLGTLAGSVNAAPATTQPISPAAARQLLSSVCKTGAASGTCKPCPTFTPDGEAEYGDGPFTPTSVIYGNFTSSRWIDALLDMNGCEPHADNYGGSLLLRWRGGASWKQTRYVSGYRTGQCLKFPAPDGRELLLCQGEFYNMGTLVQNLTLLDVRHAEPLSQILLSTEDSVDACLPDGSVQKLLSWKALPGGRFPGLRITVKSARYIRAGATPDDACLGTLHTTPSRSYTLDYRYDGALFTLKSGSEAALSALKRDNPALLDR